MIPDEVRNDKRERFVNSTEPFLLIFYRLLDQEGSYLIIGRGIRHGVLDCFITVDAFEVTELFTKELRIKKPLKNHFRFLTHF